MLNLLKNKNIKSCLCLGIIVALTLTPCFCRQALAKKDNKQIISQQNEELKVEDKVVINLESIVEFIESQNLSLHIARAEIDQAKRYYQASYGSFFPSVRGIVPVERFKGGEIFYGPIPIDLDRTTYRPALSTDYQISTGGKSVFQVKLYKNQFNRTKSSYDKIFQETLLDACRMYLNWQRDFAVIKFTGQSLANVENQLQVNESRHKTGFGTLLDVMQTKTLLSDTKNTILRAENQKDNSEISLASLLNIPLTTVLEPEDTTIEAMSLIDRNRPLTEYYKIAYESRPDIKELTYEIAQAKAEYGSAFSDLFPTIYLSGYMRGIGPEVTDLQNTTQSAASVNVDFLRNMGFNTINNIKASKAKVRQSLLTKEKKLNDIQKSIAESYHNSQYYEDQYKVFREKIQAAKEAHRIALARLKTGLGLNMEVVQAQTDLNQAGLEYVTAVMNYNISQLTLLYEIGQLTPDRVLNQTPIFSDSEANKVK